MKTIVIYNKEGDVLKQYDKIMIAASSLHLTWNSLTTKLKKHRDIPDEEGYRYRAYSVCGERKMRIDRFRGKYYITDCGRLYNADSGQYEYPNINTGMFTIVYNRAEFILDATLLVAEYFLPETQNDEPMIAYIDGDCNNHHYMNLRWVSVK